MGGHGRKAVRLSKRLYLVTPAFSHCSVFLPPPQPRHGNRAAGIADSLSGPAMLEPANSIPPSPCTACGYNLAGLEQPLKCPECGRTSFGRWSFVRRKSGRGAAPRRPLALWHKLVIFGLIILVNHTLVTIHESRMPVGAAGGLKQNMWLILATLLIVISAGTAVVVSARRSNRRRIGAFMSFILCAWFGLLIASWL